MDSETIRGALGELQQDPELPGAWSKLRAGLASAKGEDSEELRKLLAAARGAHTDRGEWDAVAALLPLEVGLLENSEERVGLLMELARVLQQELLDEAGALSVFEQVLVIAPEDELTQAAVAESREREQRWEEMAQAYSTEAEAAPDEVYRASMLMRVAEVEWRFSGEKLDEKRVLGLLAQAAECDPKNQTVLRMLERIYLKAEDFKALAEVLERWVHYGSESSARIAAALRLARLRKTRLQDPVAAAAAYELVLGIHPAQPEAMAALVEYYSEEQNWDKLVQLYERELEQHDLNRAEKVGDMLQIAMLHYRKRENLHDAAQWFSKIRAVEPTNGAMLQFFRDYAKATGDEAHLLEVLQGAQRVLSEGAEKQAITKEIAKLAEGQEDAKKAIEQYRAILRQDPANSDALESLKALYRKTQDYKQLVDLLRHELERLPESATEGRVRLLAEVATVYRDHLPNDTSLVSALNQILALDPSNAQAVRELISLYDRLGRGRDLLMNQQRLAALSDVVEEKVELLRAAGRRWLEQFSNIQNATQAFEQLLEVSPTDREARDTLSELYKKRRAWPDLFKLYERELPTLDGARRIAVMKEMAQLAAERLGNGEAASRLYTDILETEPGNLGVLDALEKQAERARDWKLLAQALERRLAAGGEPTSQVAVLQKLGTVYADQLHDAEAATGAWRRVLQFEPAQPRAMRVLRDRYLEAQSFDELEALYAEQSDFEGLAEVLSNAADKSQNIRTKIDLSYRAARVFEQKLMAPERAFRSYERILSADPMDARAARSLIPIYEREEKWARLPSLYELLLADLSGSDAKQIAERLALLKKLSDVTAHKLSDRAAAVGYARQAYELSPDDPETLELLESTCRDAGTWEPYVQALEFRLRAHRESKPPPPQAEPKGKKRGGKSKKETPAASDRAAPESSLAAATVRHLEVKLAQVYDQQLGRTDDAVLTFRRLLKDQPGDVAAGEALENLLRREGKREDLRWLFGLRVEHAAAEEQRIALLHEWATLEEEVFEDTARAAELLRRVIEFSPTDSRALGRLPRLLLTLDEPADAAQVLEQHRDLCTGLERAKLEADLAEVYLERLGKPEQALAAALLVIELGGDVHRAVEVLQRLVEVNSTKARAAAALAEIYHQDHQGRREAETLAVLLSVETEPAKRLELYERAVGVHEQLDSFGAAFEQMVKACREFPERLPLWQRAAELSARAGRPTELAEAYRDVLRQKLPEHTERALCESAAALHEDQLGDPVGATPYLERVLALEPSNHESFMKLKQILTSAQRWSELQSLYDRTAQAISEPAAKVEILGEVAMICEEFMDDSRTAARYYERMLAVDPEQEGALDALDRLYAGHEQYEQLAGLLVRRLELSLGEAAVALRLRLATLYLNQLHQPESALLHVEAVLDEDLGDTQARDLAERILEIGSLRGAAASLLEKVYEARDEIRELVRVLSIRLGVARELKAAGKAPEAEADERSLLKRIAELKNDRMRDDEGAIVALCDYIPLEPSDQDARQSLLEVGRRLGAFEKMAAVFEEAAQNAETVSLRVEILLQAARINDNSLHNYEHAAALYREVIHLEPSNSEVVLPAAKALETIYQNMGSFQQLTEILRVQLQLEQETEVRGRLLARIAGLCEEQLGDLPGAIAAWKMRTEDNPDDAVALGALDRLYQKTERYEELAQVLETRRDLAPDSAERGALIRRLAELYSGALDNPAQAIEAYRTLTEELGPDVPTLSALEVLLRKAERWDELADTYGLHLEHAPSSEERLDLLVMIGDLRKQQLSNPSGALEAYREVVSMDPGHRAARLALEGLLETKDALNRREAAEVLLPLYDGEGNHERLLSVLEILTDSNDDPIARLDVLGRSIQVAEGPLGNSQRALGYASRALREAAGHVDLLPWLEHLERLSARTGQRAEQVKLLREIAPDIFDGEVQFSVILRVATLARDELSDKELALQYFRKALEVRPEAQEALVALEVLYADSEDSSNLLEILERRAEASTSDAQRKDLLLRRAQILDQQVGDRTRAIGVYETILEIDLDPRAIAALEGLYAREQRWPELIDLFQRQIEQGGDIASLHVQVAWVAAENLGDAFRAFDELEAALRADSQHAGAIAELEKLMTAPGDAEQHARAAVLLEPIYLARADYDRVMKSLEARLEYAEVPEERHELLHRLAQLHEEQKEDYSAALETIAKILTDDLSDAAIVAEVERLAKVGDSRARLAEIYSLELAKVSTDEPHTARLSRRTGQLYRELKDAEKALLFYRRALAFEPESAELFDAVDQILTELERPSERVLLHKQALEHRFEPADRLALLHTVGKLQHESLADKDGAIATYAEILEIKAGDSLALDTLGRLYYETERFESLYELILGLAENSTDPRAVVAYRLELSKLCRKELKDVPRAIDQLEEIVRLVPGESKAIEELEKLRAEPEHKQRIVEILTPLYEQADAWRHLIKLNEDRYQLAASVSEKVQVLRDTASLWEQRGGEPTKARQGLLAAVQLDPEDVEVRLEFERLTELTGASDPRAWEALAEIYASILEQRPDLASARDLWAKLAKTHDGPRNDPRAALHAYERLRELDPSELEPVVRMEALATLLSDWATLDRVLVAKTELVLDDEERASIWRRIGEGRRDMLDDRAGAIEAYEHACELDPESAFTVDCLTDLYEQESNPQRLVELYQRRVELSDEEDNELRYNLLLLCAERQEKDFQDKHAAIQSLNQALENQPGDSVVLGRLNRLYREEAQWPELLENMRAQAEGTDQPETRASLRYEMGQLLASKLESFEEALESYRLALQDAPEHAEARAAAKTIGREHEDLRLSVAAILVPTLTQAAAHEELVEVLEMRLTVETDPVDRAQTLRSIADVLEGPLGSPGRTQKALQRAIAEAPDDADLHRSIERLCDSTGDFASYADALAERAQGTFDTELAKDLFTRLGRVAEEKLADLPRAIEAYQKAVEQVGDQPSLLSVLDRLYERVGDWAQLTEILERRSALVDSDQERAELHYRLAKIQLEKFSDPAAGLSALRAALELNVFHDEAAAALEGLTNKRDLFEEASEVLESVYRSRAMTDKLASLYEKRVGFAGTIGERIEMRRSLAKVLETELGDALGAQQVIQQGLDDDLSDEVQLQEIERLATLTGDWTSAAAALRQAIEGASMLGAEQGKALCMRLAFWYRDRVGDKTSSEQAFERAFGFDPSGEDALIELQALQSVAGRELQKVDTLLRRAQLQYGEQQREMLYREAKELAQTQGASERVEDIVRELLKHDEANAWALMELCSLCEAKGDHEETFSLLQRLTEVALDGTEVAQLRHRAAALAREQLNDSKRAVELYAQIFEDNPLDAAAANALRSLYADRAQFDDLARLLERLVDIAETPAARSQLRIELSLLNKDKFKAVDTAVELLRVVLEDEPSNSEAVVLLSRLFEDSGRDEELAELLNEQIAAAAERGDRAARLQFEVRLGEVYDAKLGDRQKAIETFARVLEQDPHHVSALRALARLQAASGQQAASAEVLERLIELVPGPEQLSIALELADAYSALSDTLRACGALERALAVQPSEAAVRERLRKLYRDGAAWEKLGNLIADDATRETDDNKRVQLLREAATIFAEQQKDRSRAAELLEKAVALKPDDRQLLMQLCDAYSSSGRAEESVRVLEQIVESYGGRRSKELADIHRRLAAAFQASGQLARAVEELDKAFRIEPGNVHVLSALGKMSLEVDDLKRAQQMFRALLLQKLEGDSPMTKAEVFYYLGLVHHRLDEKPKAVQMLERAIQTDPELSVAQELLAQLK